ncbi:response regulator [candidate division WOR-3 bacterium]|uniref:Response regulator n=1 Tax=candidate division WOR-3 bacterium TaxID=2052148 RepID=A0A9D5K7W2_UNCW3|nr:response regulator [candidate division WOR-3 bacterium]MBD3363917.1 response regulator [candidate division WOR-3 bacterium]
MIDERLPEDIRVLLIDDEEVFTEMTAKTLSRKGFKIDTASCAEEGLKKLDSYFFDVVLLDVRMPGMNGIQMLKELNEERPTQQVVMVTGHASVSTAIEAMKVGAYDFLTKPVKLDDLMHTIRRAAEHGQMERRNLALEKELQRTKGSAKIVGESSGIKKMFEFIEKAAMSDLPVLITGESGSGKELVARGIHNRSRRASHTLVVVDGSTLHEQLLVSELFGHEKGAFTGALKKKAGLFEVADRSSIFMDEIGELSGPNQTALLRVIEYGTFRPVGAVKETHTNVRIIAATNKNLEKAVADKEFRQDLYFRLKALTFHVPSLRERRTDIPLLAKYFLDQWELSLKAQVKISKDAMDILMSYNWPGNIRELRHTMELAALYALEEGIIRPQHLPDEVRKKKEPETDPAPAPNASATLPQGGEGKTLEKLEDFRDRCERNYIQKVMKQFDGNKSQVSKALGISRALLYKKLNVLGLK